MIPFNKPPYTGNEDQYIIDALHSSKLSGDGNYGKKCQSWFEANLNCIKTLLTPSCTHALEMAAILIDVQPGDEVIMPSYTFVSTANAFVLRGAKVVFVDVRPDTMNIDEKLIEGAITNKTKAIVPVHYAGVACDMDIIMDIANRHGLYVIEDAAQGMNSTYKSKPLGTIGHLGTYSFHETKNYTSGGEGGLLIVNDERFSESAEIIREKGTNRSQFFRGMVDKYSWVRIGSSYLPSELQCAYLWGQIKKVEEIQENRKRSWSKYYELLSSSSLASKIKLPNTPDECVQNAHMFYIKVSNIDIRTKLIDYLSSNDVMSVFHYVPLHSSIAGEKYCEFSGVDKFTTTESEKLLRLPLFYGITENEIQYICDHVKKFMENYIENQT